MFSRAVHLSSQFTPRGALNQEIQELYKHVYELGIFYSDDWTKYVHNSLHFPKQVTVTVIVIVLMVVAGVFVSLYVASMKTKGKQKDMNESE